MTICMIELRAAKLQLLHRRHMGSSSTGGAKQGVNLLQTRLPEHAGTPRVLTFQGGIGNISEAPSSLAPEAGHVKTWLE